MRIIFMGSPDFAVPTLDGLVAAGHDVVAAYTQPPRPKGRGKGLQPTAVETRARELGIAVHSPKSLRSEEDQAVFAALDANVAVVAAYGLILPQAILDAPRQGCLNVHGSLLPRWRGAAPVQRAIMAGDDTTGVTIMQMEAGLDTGPMLLMREVPIGDRNAAQLTEELSVLGAAMMVEVLSGLGSYLPTPQPEEGVTYAAKISKDEARLDWSRPAVKLKRHVQGLTPFPGAWFEVNGERVKVLEAEVSSFGRHPPESGGPASLEEQRDSRFRGNDEEGHTIAKVLDDALLIQCGTGALRPTLVQRAGKGAMTTTDLLRGFPIPAGTILQ